MLYYLRLIALATHGDYNTCCVMIDLILDLILLKLQEIQE